MFFSLISVSHEELLVERVPSVDSAENLVFDLVLKHVLRSHIALLSANALLYTTLDQV